MVHSLEAQSRLKITGHVAQVCGALTGSQELTVCSKNKLMLLEVLGLLLGRVALPWLKPSGWVRFTVCNGLVSMWSVKVFGVTAIWGHWQPQLCYLHMVIYFRQSFY